MDAQEIFIRLMLILCYTCLAVILVHVIWHLLPKAIKKPLCFWIWSTLAGGRIPFYRSQKLKRFRTFTEPKGTIQRWIWNGAVNYLKSIGELTHTPTLREKF